ncbi:DUF937 domain-containing protein [Dysgonomonas sp. BGC7]|uniref:DUF937 domain-containing protein n=1 Tax=Dysgonomonas sp. BGC7 TaxID=1658008 RepID=UPI0006818B26|nr:DUF937 domain-containing protein [Dysgonomonas sp. BGC7]MBD8388768.1 DUF937 domain-containing protein [Dysgonomonas sp. BGC7]
MLDGILDLVKDQAMQAITNNTDVPAEKKDAAIETTTSTIVDSLKGQLSSNNLGSIVSLFGGNDNSDIANSPLVSSIQSSVVSALSQKVGLSSSVANSIASAVIPALIGLISKKSNDPNDSFSIESLVESFSGQGNKKGGILGALTSLFGK